LLLTGVAHAAPGAVSIDTGGVLRFVAAAGDTNKVTIWLSGNSVIVDDVVALDPGPGCTPGPDATRVNCIASAINHISVRLGDMHDTVDNLTATPSTLWGDAGNDTIDGGTGNDILRGDGGADIFRGDGGHDGVTYYGIAANVIADIDGVAGDDGDGDTIHIDVEDLYGGNGNDTLRGNDVANRLVGNAGDDSLVGNDADDSLSGGDGDDFLVGSAGSDTMSGSLGNDSLFGFDGNDTLNGDDGDDRLFGHDGDDKLNGGNGNDSLYGGQDKSISDFGGNDTMSGGLGVDTVSYLGHDGNVVIDADGVIGDDGVRVNSDIIMDEQDTIGSDVENLTGGNGNDTITGNAAANVLDGGPGGDRMTGLGQVDTVTYAGRANAVFASLNGVTFDDDGENGGREGDRIAIDVENLTGGNGNDILIGNDLTNRLDGGPGDNALDCKGGADVGLNIGGGSMVNCNP
jgi:Ca2+-binding RTX toxin-like protein